MSVIDVQKFLEPVTADSPSGENLEYDPSYTEMERAALGKAEQQFGDTVIAAEEPDWRELKTHAEELLGRTRDLRVALHFARSLLHTSGIQGFADGLAILQGLVERYWDSVHPQLDPDDGNDPVIRVNTIAALCDPSSTLREVRDAILVRSRGIGNFSYRDVLMAQGELPPPTGGTKPEMSNIDGAFADCSLDELQATADAVKESLAATEGIENYITDQVGTSNAPSLSDLSDMLRSMARLLKDRLTNRGVSDAPPAEDEAEAELAENPQEQNGAATGAQTPAERAAPARLTGEINSREDVIRAIDKICDYYKRYEPSSPVPLFLNRAKRLASKSFLEILRDMTPEALSQALAIGGIADGAELSVGSDDDL
jgi:type VI secretion system protein ImpA